MSVFRVLHPSRSIDDGKISHGGADVWTAASSEI